MKTQVLFIALRTISMASTFSALSCRVLNVCSVLQTKLVLLLFWVLQWMKVFVNKQ